MEVAHGSVRIDLNDAEVVAGLRAVDAEFDRAMAKIDRQKAVAKVSADIAPLADNLAQARRALRELNGQRATAILDADKDRLDREIKKAELEVKRLDGEKATLEIKLQGEDRILEAEAAIAQAERDRARAGEAAARRLDAAAKAEARQKERDHKENLRRVNEDARVRAALERQRVRETEAMRHDELAAYRVNEVLDERAAANRLRNVHSEARTRAALDKQREREEASRLRAVNIEARTRMTLDKQREREESAAARAAGVAQDFRDRGAAKEAVRVIELQRQYARLTDKLERIDKLRPIGREARAKVELDASGVTAKMLLLKRELAVLGAHPPVDIKADINERGLKRAGRTVSNFATWVGSKLGKLSDTTVRLGPFTTSVKGLGIALSFLGPSIVAVTGALGSLIGVTGAGLAGATAIGAAGAVGLGTSFLGLMFATRNTRQEIANARTAINAYQKQVEKTGASSDKAKTKFQEMQHTFRSISPLAREAAKGTERFFSIWDKNTKPTQNSLGNIARNGFGALAKITPMWGRATNNLSAQLDKSLRSGFSFLKSGEFAQDFHSITGAFNHELPSIMRSLGNFGRAFLNFAREGANNLHMLTGGIEGFSQRLLRFTQSDTFGSTVKRWANDARDLMRFFGALTRVVVHFFGAGSSAGDDFLQTMTAALNRWDRFIQSTHGHNRLSDFFSQSVKGAQALYHLIAPIAQLFTMWAVGLEPAVRVVTTIAGWVTKVVTGLGQLVGLSDPIKTLGATMGAIFAVSKISAFVGYLASAARLIRSISAAEGIGGLFKRIATGGFFSQLSSGGGIAAAAQTGAASMEAAIISGSEAGALAMAAAISEAGAAAGVEQGLGGLAGGAEAGLARKVILPAGVDAAEIAAVGTGAAASEGAVVGLGGALGALGLTAGVAATGGLAILGGAIAYLIFKGNDAYESTKRYRDQASRLSKEMPALNAGINEAEAAYGDQAYATQSANSAYKDSSKRLRELRDELGKAKDALDKAKDANKGVATAQKTYNGVLRDTHDAVRAERDAYRSRYKERQRQNADLAAAEDKAGQAAATAWLAAYDNRVGSADKMRDTRKDLSSWRQQMAARDPGAAQRNDPVLGAAYREAKQHVDELTQSLQNQEDAQHSLDQAARDAAAVQAAVPINLQREWNHLLPLVGQAQVQLGRLARSAPNAARVIGNKFQNPINAGKIAAQANRAVQSGVSSNIVYRILVNSKSAEDALRRLRLTRLESKTLKIIEEGGPKALAVLRQLVGVDMAPKVLKILASDRDAKSKITALIHLGIPAKIAHILGDPKGALRAVAVANGLTVKSLTQVINRALGSRPELTPPPIVSQIVKRAVRNAIGTAPTGERTDSLIGEGGGPEWRVNTKTGYAYKTTGPQMVTLDPYDAIIPTETTYRQRGVDILATIAGDINPNLLQTISKDLGLSAFKTSKAPAKKAPAKPAPKTAAQKHNDVVAAANKNPSSVKPTTTSAAKLSAAKPKRHLPYAVDYKAGGVPEDWVVNQFNKHHTDLTDAQSALKSANDDLKQSMNLSKKKPKGGGQSNFDQDAKHRGTLRKQITKLEDKIGHNTAKHPNGLQAVNDLWAKRLTQVRSINSEIAHYQSIIDTDRTLMDNAATRYNRTNNDGDLQAWTRARDDRMSAIKALKPILQKALGMAKTVKVPGIQALMDSLGGDIAGLDATAEETSTADSPVEATTMDLDWLLKATQYTPAGGTAENAYDAFSKATADLAVARTDNVDDDPGTAAREDLLSLANDVAPATTLVEVLGKALDSAKLTGNNDLITETANAYSSARDDLKTITDAQAAAANATGPSQADLMDTSRASLYRDYGSNTSPNVGGLSGPSGAVGGMQANPFSLASAPSIAASIAGGSMVASALAPSVAGGAGSTSGDTTHSKQVTNNVINNFSAPPEDPHTWSKGVTFELGAMV